MQLADYEALIIFLTILYGVLSLLAYITYALDKSAAIQQKRRVREDALHVLSLLGGWPGALLAQKKYRHKTKKKRFRFFFWITVILNLTTLVWCLQDAKAVNTYIQYLYQIAEKH